MIRVTRLAISDCPKSLVIEYTSDDDNGGTTDARNTLHHRSIFLPPETLVGGVDASSIANYLRQCFPKYFGKEQVSLDQVSRLLRCLKDENQGNETESRDIGNSSKGGHDSDPDIDLNRVSESRLKKAKAQMEVIFQKAQIKPNDELYEYDKRVEYEPESDSSWD